MSSGTRPKRDSRLSASAAEKSRNENHRPESGIAHLVGFAALIGLGFLLNDTLKENTYQGLFTVLSAGFGIYCFAVNILYHKNQTVFLWVNRALLLIRRTHTYWLPDFDFTLSDTKS